MIENVLEIKDTHVREVMTPLVDVVAIDAGATLIDFHSMWLTHQYSRQCFDNHTSLRRILLMIKHDINTQIYLSLLECPCLSNVWNCIYFSFIFSYYKFHCLMLVIIDGKK